MRVPDNFIPANGPNLVEASAGTGKTTWMVRTAVRLLLKEPGMPVVSSANRLLAVTFTRAATAELKERIRGALHEVKRIRDGEAPTSGSEWIGSMLETCGASMSKQLDQTLASLDRLAVTTIHGFCKGALEEFALDCGVPVGLQFIEQDRQYRDEAISDEWRTLTWQPGPVSEFVLGERMNGATTRWSPTTLEAAARVVRQGIGAERPSRVDRLAELAKVRATLDSILEHWDEDRLRRFHSQIKWNKDGITSDDVDALCAATGKLRAGEEPVVLDITRWARSAVESVAHKTNKTNKELIPGERFLDACEVVHSAYDNAASLIWQDAVLSIAERMERAMERDRVAGFDEMIGYLQRAITDKDNGERLRGVLASRYDAVLVDEFQDTDWPQWSIFSGTFGIKPLVLVGDPKQSIYGFRGADITAYRAARESAAEKGDNRVFSLDRNYRSDRKLVDATEILFSQTAAPFAVEQSVLAFEHVDAERTESSLTDGDLRPLVMVDLERARADEQEKKITLFIAAEVARLLRDPAVLYQGPSDDKPRRLKPSDIAILVSANRQAAPLLDALRAYRVPAVSGATGDIAESAMWQDVLLLVGAIEDPSDPRVVRRALSTSIGGKSAPELAALESNGDEWRQLIERLAEARHDWTSFGVLTALMRLINDWGARDTLAAYPDGERRLTDFRHIVSLLQDGEREGHRNPTMLLAWAHRFAAESDWAAEYRQQHLESDDDAVTISTVHVAKGLEWPVVFCAYLWKAPFPRVQVPHIARFPDSTRRIVFEDVVEGEIPGDTPLSENLRLAYVALTRARSRTYVIWAELLQEGKGAIHHLLSSIGTSADTPSQVLANNHPDLISRMSEDDTRHVPVFPETGEGSSSINALQARELAIAPRQLQTWTVSSYSRFTRGLKIAVDATEVGPVDDAEAVVNDSLRADQLPGGAHTGNALHELFEHFDFTVINDQTAVDAAINDVLVRYALPRVGADDAQRVGAAELVRRMMVGALAAPIPGATKGLSTIKPDQTLREWRFHLSMEHVSPAQFASVFKKHGEGWLSGTYAPSIARVSRAEIDGFLTGIVDHIALIDGRWWVIDWKSNTLGATAAAYDGKACRQVMMNEHYVLQYHIYIVALHRFLRSRLGQTYEYERDFGGVGYAFLRGLAMGAPSWFVDRPSLELVEALDACIGGYPR